MKTLEFQHDIGGTVAYMKRKTRGRKGCGQLFSNEIYFSDIRLSRVKTSKEYIYEGVDYCRPVKTIHKGFFIATFEKLMKEWTRGYYLVMNITPGFTVDRPLITDLGAMKE